MPNPSFPRCCTTNWPAYNAAPRRRGSLLIFDPEMSWAATKTGKRGHPETFFDSAIQICLTLKVLFGLPLRQTVGLVASLIEMAGLNWPVPDFSTLCRRQARLAIDKDNSAQHAPVINAGFAVRPRKEALQTCHLLIRQPEKIAHVTAPSRGRESRSEAEINAS